MIWYGEKGAPSSLRDLLDDMDDVEDSLERLYTSLNGGKLPEEEHVTFEQKAEALRKECLFELLSNTHRAQPSRFGYDAKGFANPDQCSKYEEIIYLYGKWTLLDGYGNQYQVECMPLEEFCEMVDNILNRKE